MIARTLLVTLLLAVSANAQDSTTQQWLFDVYIDDKRIGSHRFEVDASGDERKLTSVADFKVKFLFVTAYRYEHRNVELWRNDCLVSLDAETNDNGKDLSVSGERRADGFTVQTGDTTQELPPCVMSFAYWNPDFLEAQKLLNPQTGEYLDVEIEQLENEPLEVNGETISAQRYRITAKKMELTVWYSADKEWLALESVGKGGRLIRYRLA